MALPDQLTDLAGRTKQLEDSAAAATENNRTKLEQDREKLHSAVQKDTQSVIDDDQIARLPLLAPEHREVRSHQMSHAALRSFRARQTKQGLQPALRLSAATWRIKARFACMRPASIIGPTPGRA
jgi:hypothetical protein